MKNCYIEIDCVIHSISQQILGRKTLAIYF